MKIGILGSGTVAQTLGAGFIQSGHAVMLGSSDPAKLADGAAAQAGAHSGSFAEAAAFGDVVVLAVKGAAAEAVLSADVAAAIAGKTVIDTCNPIAEGPPVNGVLSYFTGSNDSLLERLQAQVPAARFVKAFNSVGTGAMIHPKLAGGVPTMFICGADAHAKQDVTTLLREFGWDAADMGGVEAARAIEPLCRLWCILGFKDNSWGHAFSLLRPA